MNNLHRSATQNIRRTYHHRIADFCCLRDDVFGIAANRILWLFQLQLMQQLLEAFAILRQINRIHRGADNRDTRLFQSMREFQWRLSAELHDDPFYRAIYRFRRNHFHHVFCGQRLKIKPVGRIVIGRNRFRITVNHDGLIARLFQRIGGMHTAIIELNPLTDAVGTPA